MFCVKVVPTRIESLFAQNSILPSLFFLLVIALEFCSSELPPKSSSSSSNVLLNLHSPPVSWRRFKRDGKFDVLIARGWDETLYVGNFPSFLLVKRNANKAHRK